MSTHPNYPFDTVKIDQFFIQELGKKNNKASRSVIKALIELSKELQFAVLAEGVEKKSEMKALTELGCQYAQGFYFCKPVSIDAINQKLQK